MSGHPGPEPILRTADGAVVVLPLSRWKAPPGPAEEPVLARAAGPVLDIGCGPGRHTYALAGRGVVTLGIDTSPTAVASARRRGCSVLRRSVFDRLPHEGRWGTALLIDGNIGIGGHPVGLLNRVRALLAGPGHALVEVEPPGARTVTTRARIERQGQVGPWFAWARVGLDGVDRVAGVAGLRRTWTCEQEGRWFVQLTS
jgi:SAM-dependent methyltransferase